MTEKQTYEGSINKVNMTMTARVIEALWVIMESPDQRMICAKQEPTGEWIIKISEITRVVNEIVRTISSKQGEKNSSRWKITSPRVGQIVREELNLQITERRQDGFWVIWDEPNMPRLAYALGSTRTGNAILRKKWSDEMTEIKQTYGGLINGRHLVECVHDRQRDQYQLAVMMDGRMVIGDQIEIDGEIYEAAPISPLIKMASADFENAAIKRGEELDELTKYFERWMVISASDALMLSAFVLSTWMYDRYDTTPALRIIGRIGDGKTRLLTLLEGVCYRPFCGNTTLKVRDLAIIADRYHGTILLDEADAPANKPMRELCETGTNKNNSLNHTYDTYGPRVMAMRRKSGDYNDLVIDLTLENQPLMWHGREEQRQPLGKNWIKDAQRLTDGLMRMRLTQWWEKTSQGAREVAADRLRDTESNLGARLAVGTTILLNPERKYGLSESLRLWWQYIERRREYTYVLSTTELKAALSYILDPENGREDDEDADVVDILLSKLAGSVYRSVILAHKDYYKPEKLADKLVELGVIHAHERQRNGMHVYVTRSRAREIWEAMGYD